VRNKHSGAAGLSADANMTDDPAARIWVRSSRCGGAGSCVEIADLGAHVAVRDGKRPESSPVLIFSDEEWLSFISGVKAGDFDR
jgi:hypothetical protein